MQRYSLGLDFGTESVRALLVEVENGKEVAQSSFDYPHGVIDDELPTDGARSLAPDWFLQAPSDYVEGLDRVVPAVIRRAGVDPHAVIGIGLDFTSCTLLPTDANGEPLCWKDEFRQDPQAWVKLWKHHGAAEEASRIERVAEERGEPFMDYFAHAISCEWLLPKVLETKHRSPDVYEAAYTFVEACDWIPWLLTGQLARNACCAGFKAQYNEKLGGYPASDFLEDVEPGFGRFFESKMAGAVVPAGKPVGELSEEWADRLGLVPGIPVSAGMIDAHMGVPGAGVTEPGEMVVVLGTSFCHMMLGDELKLGEGPLGVVSDGIIPGLYAYESGQSAGGDIYAWYADNGVPPEYHRRAENRGESVHDVLTEDASKLDPGQSGLLALDWWNGNRSILMDDRLSGLLVGATLHTRPPEIYRALVEATAFGTRRILDAYAEDGIGVRSLMACGGMPENNPWVMQVFSDVCNRSINVVGTSQAMALGAAMCGAAAAGEEKGGYQSVREAGKRMSKPARTTYEPVQDAVQTYDRLYEEYCHLHDKFGREDGLMHRLRDIRKDAT